MIDGLASGSFAAIAVMALTTYACRIGGFVLMGRLRMNPPLERALRALPGAIVAATVVPVALGSGAAAIASILVAIGVTHLTRRDIAGLASGFATAFLWRAIIPGS